MFALVSSCAVSLFPLFVLGKAHGSVAKAFLLMVIIKNHFTAAKSVFLTTKRSLQRICSAKFLHPSPIKAEQNLPYCQHLNQSDMEIWIYALVKREPNYQIVWEVALLLLLHISPHFHFLPNSDSSPPDSSASNCFGAFLRQHGR